MVRVLKKLERISTGTNPDLVLRTTWSWSHEHYHVCPPILSTPKQNKINLGFMYVCMCVVPEWNP